MFCFRLKSRFISKVTQFVTKNHLCCKRHDRNTGYFADIRYSTAGTRIYLDYIDIFSAYDKLNVNHTDNVQRFCQPSGVFFNCFLCSIRDGTCRINRNTVARMDTGSLDMFHDTRNQNILSITDCIDFDFFSLKILINQNRVFLCNSIDDSDILFHVFIVDCNLHTLTAKYIRRTN